jgi:putative transposase
MLVCARLRHVAASEWGSKRYMDMEHLFKMEIHISDYDIYWRMK